MTKRENDINVIIEKLKRMGLPLELSIHLSLSLPIHRHIGACCAVARIITEWDVSGEMEKKGVALLEELCVIHFK